ncbi:GDSL family lipase [Amycolatopsis antarctica]|uniref:GDSL family lipase n=1 Tax=Amycolatopsis antarctica TaxID=1854586 RepID=A0A263D0Y6_9PSEU|nr:SGNH/GDSL hydrolase family protein [Amycolatopsis antarctica]OZM71879.1 GDSL family lipase [Amycolatopsis antarctica]
MRVKRVLAPVLLMLAVVASGAVAAPGATAAEGKYVALGDSYTVAVGTRTYDDPNDDCRRGPLAYPRLWAEAHPSTTFVEASCSGAITDDIINSQVPQITADTTLVTVQVGGNDAGFVDVLKDCILSLDDAACVARAEEAKALAQGTVAGKLASTYSAVKAAAPSAKVVSIGYPRLYKVGGDCGILGLSDTERAALNSAADVLAEVTAAQSSAAGVTFLDARTVFDGHGICSGSEWVTSLEWDKLDESYHPNTTGHRDGYLAALNAIAG